MSVATLPLAAVRLDYLHADLDERLHALRGDASAAAAGRAVVDAALREGGTYYGINTGFGILKSTRIADDQLTQLQHNLLRSHAVGVGEPMPKAVTALMLKLKIHALGQGFSGVSLPVLERLLAFDAHGLTPVVPTRGSVGASGDLVPLSHLALPLIGDGALWGADGTPQPAAEVLHAHGWTPLDLQPKDGLALINGTQLMSAYGAYLLHKAQALVRMADVLAAMSLEALRGSRVPFDARLHAVRPHKGHGLVAQNMRRLLDGSAIMASHQMCGKVQDPYSLRCVPQVHGASRDALAYASAAIETEINSVTDNPLVFPDGAILSGGNFHGQPLALALDTAAMALAELASISERRTYLLLEGHDGLPPLLMRETGLNSGFMIPQYTAASLVSENKVLCHPACVDSIPTSLGQEDHVSMGSIGALKLWQVYHNVENVLAIELLCAAQALDYRLPLQPGEGVACAHRVIRERIAHREADSSFQDDLKQARHLLQPDGLLPQLTASTGALA
ncbi:MAG: histidine ammonia-lyase [Rhodothermales bacterium]